MQLMQIFAVCFFLFSTLLQAEEGLLENDESILGEEFLEELHADNGSSQTLSAKTFIYNQTDSNNGTGGNKNIDEDLRVFEQIVLYTNQINERDSMHAQILADVVSSASIERKHNSSYRSLQSGASGTFYARLTGGWKRKLETFTFNLHGGAATEYAYQSVQVGAGISKPMNEQNTTLSLNIQSFFDSIRMVRFDGTQDNSDTRTTYTGNLQLTHILTRDSVVNATVSHTSQSGFLATQFNSVFIAGVEDFEVLPDSRSRDSLTLRYKHAIGDDAAVETGVRYYTDDWGVAAYTVNCGFEHYVNERSLLLAYSYRYYQQHEADAYQPFFDVAEPYQTSDPDLGDFEAHTMGIKIRFMDVAIFGQDGEWDLGVHYRTQDNGLNMMWLMSGMSFSF